MHMYSNKGIINLSFVFFLIHVPHELSAECLNCTKERNFRNGFSPSINQDGFNHAVVSGGNSRNYNTIVEDRGFTYPRYKFGAKYLVPDVSEVKPSKENEIFMVIPIGNNNNIGTQTDLWIFAKVIGWGVLVEMGMTSIIVGVAIKYMEYRAGNAEFSGPLLHQFFLLLWFPFSVLVFHEGHLANKWSKGIVFIWLCMAFLVIQCYIANLFSFITSNHPQLLLPTQDSYIGYRDPSIKQIIVQQYGFDESRLKFYSSIEEYQLALSRGSYRGGVDAIFDQSIIVDLFIRSYGSGYIKIGPIRKAIGFGYAFFSGFDYHFNFPIKSEYVDESSKVGELRKESYKYHFNEEPSSNSSQTQSLSAYNFGGIFIITWILIILAILCSEYFIWRKSIKTLTSNSVEASVQYSTSEMIEVHEDSNTIFETQEDTSSSTSSITNEEELTQEE